MPVNASVPRWPGYTVLLMQGRRARYSPSGDLGFFFPQFGKTFLALTTFLPFLPRGAKSEISAATAGRRFHTVPREQRHLSASSAKERYSCGVPGIRSRPTLLAFELSCSGIQLRPLLSNGLPTRRPLPIPYPANGSAPPSGFSPDSRLLGSYPSRRSLCPRCLAFRISSGRAIPP